MITVQTVYDIIHGIAPFDTQEDYDNAGLLTGDPAWEVRGVHLALDVTMPVIDEAIRRGANLIVTHHPLMFSPRRRLTETDGEGQLLCRLIRERIAFIAAHTNLDRAPGGTGDALADRIGLVCVRGEDFLRVGDLPAPMTAADLALDIGRRLNTLVRCMGDPEQAIRRVGLCTGAGSDFWPRAAALGAEAFLTGESKHHHALAAVQAGLVMLEAGHFATEAPGIFALADALQIALNGLQYKGYVSTSTLRAYG